MGLYSDFVHELTERQLLLLRDLEAMLYVWEKMFPGDQQVKECISTMGDFERKVASALEDM